MSWIGKPGDIVVRPFAADDFQAALANLCARRIWPAPKWKFGIRGLLPEFLSLLDSLVYFERIVLFEPLWHDDPIVSEFKKKGIIYSTSEYWDWDWYEELFSTFGCITEDDTRSFVLDVCLNPLPYTDWLKKNGLLTTSSINSSISLEKKNHLDELFTSTRSPNQLDEIAVQNSRLRENLDIEKLNKIASVNNLFKSFNSLELALCFDVQVPVMETTASKPYNNLTDRILKDRLASMLHRIPGLSKRQKNGVQIVLEALHGVRNETTDLLLKKEIISFDTPIDTPFSLDLLLSKCDKSCDLIDSIFDVRNDSKNFRKWLVHFNETLANGNLAQIVEVVADVEAACALLRDEFSHVSTTRKISRSYSELAGDLVSILTDPVQRALKRVIEKFLSVILDEVAKHRFSHLFYMQKLGRSGIDINLKEKLIDVFGKQQGTLFQIFLREVASRQSIADKVAALPLSRRAVINFEKPMTHWRRSASSRVYFGFLIKRARKDGIVINRDNPLEGLRKFAKMLQLEIQNKGLRSYVENSMVNWHLDVAQKMRQRAQVVAKMEKELVQEKAFLLDAKDPQMVWKGRLYAASRWFRIRSSEHYAETIATFLGALGEHVIYND